MRFSRSGQRRDHSARLSDRERNSEGAPSWHEDLYRFVWARKVPAKKVGGQWRISRAGLEEFIGVAKPLRLDEDTLDFVHCDQCLEALTLKDPQPWRKRCGD